MSKQRKRIFVLTGILALTFGMMTNVSAMHIMEGYLPGGFCIAWGALCIPFLVAGFLSIKKTLAEHKNLITLLAMSGAFVFVISSLKIPSVTGSCSHMTGTGLGAILFGPSAVSILGLIVLLFQAILLAHGGLTTIGANTFSMAIAGPFVSYGIFVLCKKAKVNKIVSVFLAATLGDLFTYCVTAAQMALAHNADTTFMVAMGKFLTVFAPTQVPLAIIEGIITVLIIQGLETYAKPELRAIGYLKEENNMKKKVFLAILLIFLIAFVPLFALKDAEFGGSDDAGSQVVEEVDSSYEPWATPIFEKLIGGELPGEVESLLFCLQTGIGVGVIAFIMGRFVERKKWMKDDN